MTKKSIYLAGNISSDIETYKWREKATQLLEAQYTILNPAANKFNKMLIKQHKTDLEEFKKDAIKKSQGILIVKDYQLVVRADIILVNLQIITPDKPMIGTMFELAWAWQLKKPVIAIVDEGWYSKHPFPFATFSARVETLEGACDIIKYFFEE
jgi:nucleoside 2-deoxyribosyltransferase